MASNKKPTTSGKPATEYVRRKLLTACCLLLVALLFLTEFQQLENSVRLITSFWRLLGRSMNLNEKPDTLTCNSG